MDIARTPSTPDGNPEMADAAHEMTTPVEIRRADYRPFGWLVPQVALDFALGVDSTTVIATLTVTRNPQADPTPVIQEAFPHPRCDGRGEMPWNNGSTARGGATGDRQ